MIHKNIDNFNHLLSYNALRKIMRFKNSKNFRHISLNREKYDILTCTLLIIN